MNAATKVASHNPRERSANTGHLGSSMPTTGSVHVLYDDDSTCIYEDDDDMTLIIKTRTLSA